MEIKEAVRIVLEYAKHDTTVGGFSEAIQALEEKFIDPDKTLNWEADKFEQKDFEIGVRQVNLIVYKVRDFSESLAAKQVQDCIDKRDWEKLLKYPPKHDLFKPIPPFSFDIMRCSVKEDVLRS